MRIDRDFQDPKIVEALSRVDEATLGEILADAELLETLKRAKADKEPISSRT